MNSQSDLRTFQHNLGRELVAAAHRRNSAITTARLGAPSRMLLAGAVVVVVALLGTTLLRPQPAAASVFAISRFENAIQLDVIDIVTDPDSVVIQLDEELDISATLLAVPSPAQLEGRLVVAGSNGDIAPEVRFEAGAIAHIVLPVDFDGDLLIEYGRPAEPGEPYQATTTDPSCADYWAQTPSESLAEIALLAPNIRFEAVDETGSRASVPTSREIDPAYLLIDITYLSSSDLVVTYAANPSVLPQHPNCR